MSRLETGFGFLLAGALGLWACGGSEDLPVPDGGTGGPPPACGGLVAGCGASEYCLVSSILRPGDTDLILTSECVAFPPPQCPETGSMNDVCTCLIDDAKARSSNCSRPGAAFFCDTQGGSSPASPRFTLTCGFRP
jgi:hypothetical protein